MLTTWEGYEVSEDSRDQGAGTGKRVNPSLGSRFMANVRWVFTLLFGRTKATRAKRPAAPTHRADPETPRDTRDARERGDESTSAERIEPAAPAHEWTIMLSG
jgi:hypothetical protein